MKIWKIITNISAVIGVLAVFAGIIWAGFQFNERTHTSEEMVEKAEEMLEDYDPKASWGEYILDSVEEVETKEWRAEQEQIQSVYNKELDTLKTLLKLNIRISDEAKEAAENPH